MKKFMKGCAITALIFVVAGCLLGAMGSSVAGRTNISRVVETATGGKVHVDIGGWWDWDIRIDDPDEKFDLSDATGFDQNHEVQSGDIAKYYVGGDIRNLDIEVGGCSFETKKSEDDGFYLEVKNARKFQGYVSDDTLYINATVGTVSAWSSKTCEIILYLPEDYHFDEVNVNLGAGSMEFEGLLADSADFVAGAGQITLEKAQIGELNVEVGAGRIALEEMEIGQLDAEVGLGEFVAKGVLNGDAVVECSMGNVEMEIDGREEDFNFDLSGAMGNIDLGKSSFGGFSQSQYIDHKAGKNMSVECSMGNISIRFKN